MGARIIFVVAYRIQTYIFQSSNHCQRCRGQQQKQRRRRRQQQKLPGGRGRAGKRRRLLRDSFSLHLNDSMTIEKKKKSLSNHSPLLLSLWVSVLLEGAIKSEERLSHLKKMKKNDF